MTSADNYSTKLLKSAATFLSRWQGAHAQLWDLRSSIRTLRIVIQHPGRSGNLSIYCIDPIDVRSPIEWDNCQIAITQVQLPDGSGPGFRIADEIASCEILCGTIELKENAKLG